jgi:hypothetical protein
VTCAIMVVSGGGSRCGRRADIAMIGREDKPADDAVDDERTGGESAVLVVVMTGFAIVFCRPSAAGTDRDCVSQAIEGLPRRVSAIFRTGGI